MRGEMPVYCIQLPLEEPLPLSVVMAATCYKVQVDWPAPWTSTEIQQGHLALDHSGWTARWCTAWCDQHRPYPESKRTTPVSLICKSRVTSWSITSKYKTHFSPVSLAGGAGRCHFGLLLALLQLLTSQHHLAGIVTATRTIPETGHYIHITQ